MGKDGQKALNLKALLVVETRGLRARVNLFNLKTGVRSP